MKNSRRILAIRENRAIRKARMQEIEELEMLYDTQVSEHVADAHFGPCTPLSLVKQRRQINNTLRQIRRAQAFYQQC